MIEEIRHRVDKLLVEMAVVRKKQAEADLMDHNFDRAYAFAHQAAALGFAQIEILALFDKIRKEIENG